MEFHECFHSTLLLFLMWHLQLILETLNTVFQVLVDNILCSDPPIAVPKEKLIYVSSAVIQEYAPIIMWMLFDD